MTDFDNSYRRTVREQEFNNQDFFRSSAPLKNRIIQRAVVVDVIFDPSRLADQATWLGGDAPADVDTGEPMDKEKDKLEKDMVMRGLLAGAPRNSIIVRPIEDAADQMNFSAGILCYPLFPPHLCLPVKAGEQVMIIDPTPGKFTDIMYWICRAAEPDYVDDLNFTHGDRTIMESPTKMDFGLDEGPPLPGDEPPTAPGFENGQGHPSAFTLTEDDPENPIAYDQIFTGSMANRAITLEPVPRFTKRPGDLALQGSNNTLICLGEDRGYSADPTLELEPNSNANFVDLPPDMEIPSMEAFIPAVTDEATRTGRGTIDIVAGRGRGEFTEPLTISNTRKFDEVNKNPVNWGEHADNNHTRNPQEGDPDFGGDLSRVYISMKTSGDTNLGLTSGFGGDKGVVHPVPDKPYVILKSDEVRIVAREGGSIRLVKEGPGIPAPCAINMLADGKLCIEADKIYLGSSGIAEVNEAQPVFRGADLKAALDAFADFMGGAINGFGGPLIGALAAVDVFKKAVDDALSGKTYVE